MELEMERSIVVKEETEVAVASEGEGGDFGHSQENQLKSMKVKMGEMIEENGRLKTVLGQTMKDYQSLQTHYFDIVQQKQCIEPVEMTPIDNIIEEPEFVSLTLGTSSSEQKNEEKTYRCSKNKEDGLTLGLACRYEGSISVPSEPPSSSSPENSIEELKEEDVREPWPPSKMQTNLRNGCDGVSTVQNVKRARVSIRTRGENLMLHDGCHWRKYGQKTAKGNPCPRAYYRCTDAPECPVRKQVQKCAEDSSILITTYEGIHNHPLPPAATTLASATTAAAQMLMSGSSASRPAATFSGSSSATTVTGLQIQNFLPSGFQIPRQSYLPNTSISSLAAHPTITLDLTAPPPPTPQHFQLSGFTSNNSSTSTHISTTTSLSSYIDTKTVPSTWSNGHQSFQRNIQNATNIVTQPISQRPLTDTIAEVIVSDANFRSVLANAITSYVGDESRDGYRLGRHLAAGWSSANLNSQQRSLVQIQPSPVALPRSKSDPVTLVDNRLQRN